MSIIYDALKKVERSLGSYQMKSEKKPAPRPSAYLFYAAVAVIGIIATGVFYNFFSPRFSLTEETLSPSPKITKIPGVSLSVKENSAIFSPPLPLSSQLKNKAIKKLTAAFKLNGVFFSENEGYALINDQIVKEGDTINEATVSKISLDGVELKTSDSLIIKLTGKK